MPNLNKVFLMGNLTRDPEMRYTPSNTAVVDFGLAVNRTWRNQQGEQQEETTFVDCTAFARTAEVINQYLQKGRPLFIEGRLRLERWQAQDGTNRSKLSVVVDRFEFLDSRRDSDNGGGGGGGGGGRRGGANERGSSGYSRKDEDMGPPQNDDSHTAMEEEDIPF